MHESDDSDSSRQPESVGASAGWLDQAMQIRELNKMSRHFSSIASRFALGSDTAAYQRWSPHIRSQLREFNLEHVLTSDPKKSGTGPLALQQQKTVYHILYHCATTQDVRSALTSALPESEQTGYGAWRALRAFFIGNEQAHLQSLESQLQSLQWKAGEDWNALETRFEALLSELEAAGALPLPHQRQMRLMDAIQAADRRDAQDSPVYSRLNVINMVKAQAPYREWLLSIRHEALKVQTELTKRGTKRPRDETTLKDGPLPVPAQQVSFVAAPGRGRAPAKPGVGPARGPAICLNMARTGRCSFGNTCRYSHDLPPAARTPHSDHSRKADSCIDFSLNRCFRGDRCKYAHAPHPNGGAAALAGLKSEPSVHFAEVYTVQRAVLGATTQPSHPHRTILDSGASISITPRREFIRDLQPLKAPVTIRGAFGREVVATHGGEGRIPLGGGVMLVVPDLVFCESCRDTLLCQVDLSEAGHSVDLHRGGGGVFTHRSGARIPLSTRAKIVCLDIGDYPVAADSAETNATTRSMRQSEQATPVAADEAAEHRQPTATDAPRADSTPGTHGIPASSLLAHARYGHLGGRKLDQLIEHDAADGLIVSQKHAAHARLVHCCDACMQAKAHKSAFGKEIDHAARAPNDMAVADVCGPIVVKKSDAGEVKFYLSVITDVFSRYSSALVMPDKRPTDHVLAYWQRANRQTGRELKHFHTDGGKEYNHAERTLEERGVKVTRTPIHTPQWNGIAERKNRTIMETARALMFHAGLDPDEFWQFAIETAVFTLNRTHSVGAHHKTAYELFTGHRPDVNRLRVFGCDAFVLRAGENLGKLDARAKKGIFVGYDTKREGAWRVWVAGEVTVSTHVEFQEDSFEVAARHRAAYSGNGNGGDALAERIARCIPTEGRSHGAGHGGESGNSSNISSESEGRPRGLANRAAESGGPALPDSSIDHATWRRIEAADKAAAAAARAKAAATSTAQGGHHTRRSTRNSTPAKRDGLNPDDFEPRAFAVSSSVPEHPLRVADVPLPATSRAALKGPHAAYWKAAMDSEMASIEEHGTWELVPPPSDGSNIVSCKWVFALKEKDGFVERFKARVVARGFTQQQGVDYEETYASVVRFKALRIILAIVAMWDLELELMDVKTAYLNASLKERVFMRQPEGYERGGLGFVCLLRKALYGLKQSGREWWQHLRSFLESIGFSRCVNETCVYVRVSRNGRPIILAVYVDDLTGAFHSADRAEWEEVKAAFARRFSITFLGDAEWLLSMRITRDRTRRLLWLDQHAYTESMLEEFRMDEMRAVDHPGAQSALSKADCPTEPEEAARMARLPYKRLVGLLIYLASCTRPDIAFNVHLLAQFSQNPGAAHWRALMQILRYLRGTPSHGLLFDGNNTPTAQAVPTASAGALPQASATAFVDASYAGCKDTLRSTTGWLVRLGNCWVSWRCHKQTTVALSSSEAEYVATTDAGKELKWLYQLLEEIGFHSCQYGGAPQTAPAPLLLTDNRSCIAMANTDSLHQNTKHIDTKEHWIRGAVERGIVQLRWISSEEQVADILTKTLPPRLHRKFSQLLVVPTASRSVA